MQSTASRLKIHHQLSLADCLLEYFVFACSMPNANLGLMLCTMGRGGCQKFQQELASPVGEVEVAFPSLILIH